MSEPTAETWYEVKVVKSDLRTEVDNSPTSTLGNAKQAIKRLQILYPEHMIFVRQYTRGRHGFRVLHKLTVHIPATFKPAETLHD